MYRGKRQMTQKVSKEIAKETTHNGKAHVIFADEMPIPPPRKVLEKAKMTVKNKDLLKKAQAPKLQKGFTKHSKRTNVGEVPSDSMPAHVHPEGKRWIKNLAKQNVVKNRMLGKKLTKNR